MIYVSLKDELKYICFDLDFLENTYTLRQRAAYRDELSETSSKDTISTSCMVVRRAVEIDSRSKWYS